MIQNTPPISWPRLSYAAFQPSAHLLHMVLQVLGKLKLKSPFHAQWSEVALLITPRGLTTGPIPCPDGIYALTLDFLTHQVEWQTSAGRIGQVALGPGSVAAVSGAILDGLRQSGLNAEIDMMPQEVANPIAFDKDDQPRAYDRDQVGAWWGTVLAAYRVLYAFQGRFTGKTQPIGLMWGTMDLRVPLYNGKPVKPPKDMGFIRRNAMYEGLMELGWWAGDDSYQKPAFYAFVFPEPKGIGQHSIGPDGAAWSAAMGEFILDQDSLLKAPDPDEALMTFLESSYAACAKAADWDVNLMGAGKPT